MRAKRVLVFISLGLFLLFPWKREPRFFINETISMPRGIYRFLEKREPRVGDIVVVDLPGAVRTSLKGRSWLPPNKRLLKKVIGTEGDKYCSDNGLFVVDGTSYGPIFEKDADGRALPSFSHCETVPSGHILLFGEGIERSFDSRYFGALPEELITAKVELVFSY